MKSGATFAAPHSSPTLSHRLAWAGLLVPVLAALLTLPVSLVSAEQQAEAEKETPPAANESSETDKPSATSGDPERPTGSDTEGEEPPSATNESSQPDEPPAASREPERPPESDSEEEEPPAATNESSQTDAQPTISRSTQISDSEGEANVSITDTSVGNPNASTQESNSEGEANVSITDTSVGNPNASTQESNSEGEANVSITDTSVGTPNARAHPVLDRIWSWPQLYKNPDAPFLQSVSLFGRYHGQFYAVESAQGSTDGWDNRRGRLGAKATFFQNFTLAGDINVFTGNEQPESGNVIDNERIDTLTLAWQPEDDFQIVIGQQKPGFIYEYDVSSNRILTFERSLIVNQLAPDKSPGISIEGTHDKFFYEFGGYSGNEFRGRLRNGFALAKIGYDLSEFSKREKMSAELYYLYNSTGTSLGAAPYRNSFSHNITVQEGPYSGVLQTVFAEGYGRVSDAWGVTIMPSYYLIEDKVQLVARYQLSRSRGPDGLQLQSRYELDAPFVSDSGLGDRYQAGYLGLNWYIYDKKLKIMSGVECSKMNGGGDGGDFSGWTFFNGFRMHF